jgi:flavodoxin
MSGIINSCSHLYEIIDQREGNIICEECGLVIDRYYTFKFQRENFDQIENISSFEKDFVYETYIVDLVHKEPAESATDRTITEIMDWCEKNKADFNLFFNIVSANEAAFMIKTGKISPWVLYLCESGGRLMSKFSEDHAKMITGVIEPAFWMKKFKNNTEDVNYIKTLLEQAGL